jgi:hypothetical protein
MTRSETGASSHVTWYYYNNHEPTSKWHRSISSQIHQITSALWIEAHLTEKCKGDMGPQPYKTHHCNEPLPIA